MKFDFFLNGGHIKYQKRAMVSNLRLHVAQSQGLAQFNTWLRRERSFKNFEIFAIAAILDIKTELV